MIFEEFKIFVKPEICHLISWNLKIKLLEHRLLGEHRFARERVIGKQ